MLLPNAVKAKKEFCERLTEQGYSRIFNLEKAKVERFEDIKLTKDAKDFLLVLDRIKSSSVSHVQLSDSVRQALSLNDGACILVEQKASSCYPKSFLQIINDSTQENRSTEKFRIYTFSEYPICNDSDLVIEKPRPALFSYNSPLGACPECKGFGKVLQIDPELCVPNPTKTIQEKALHCWAGDAARGQYRRLIKFCEKNKIPIDVPWLDLAEDAKQLLFEHRSREYSGVYPWFKSRERKAYKMHVRVFLSRFRSQVACSVCEGSRLKPSGRMYRLLGKTLPDLWAMPVGDLYQWLCKALEYYSNISSSNRELKRVSKTILNKLKLMCHLGLPYLALSRAARTLSGGETQRVNLVGAIGSELVSTQFVLDEPSVGLHPRDTERLITSVQTLARKGNSVLMVEHDLDCIEAADHIIELGPESGEAGGEITFNDDASKWPAIEVNVLNSKAKKANKDALKIENAKARNLKNLKLKIPLGKFVGLCGVSGSGKSTLAIEVIQNAFNHYQLGIEDKSNAVTGFNHLDKVLVVDQAPLSKSPRGNIATYSKFWDSIRTLLASTDEAKARALGKSAFSFNVDAGRCPACSGAGFIREDMQFLSDVYIQCEVCLGKRFQEAVLEVQYKGKNVYDFLCMSVNSCAKFFHGHPVIEPAADTLAMLGLGHLTLGHPLSDLSGGEAQRLKLIPFIQKSGAENSLLIFDEPTTGLHVKDIVNLIELFHWLQDKGHSILCIEHNLQLLSSCDWLLELGPEGGEEGGYLVAEGTPQKFISGKVKTYTADHLERFNKAATVKKKVKRTKKVLQKPANELIVRGAKEHNLKNITVRIPFGQIVALTGVSGSGKSSIAKDIIYAEGQRRYLDCLSPYARQFIKELSKPDIDAIENVPPTICVYQHTYQPSELSTVATMSELYHYLRLLYSKVGTQYCPDHPDAQISPLTAEQIATEIKQLNEKKIRILAPVIKQKKGFHKQVFQRAISSEINEVRVDGVFGKPSKFIEGLERNKPHSIEFSVASCNPSSVPLGALQDAVQQSLSLGAGFLIVNVGKKDRIYSIERTCPVCRRGFFKPDPEDLSFNSKRGRCQKCNGTGKNARGDSCSICSGTRLLPVGRNIRFNNKNIYDACNLTAPELLKFLNSVVIPSTHMNLAEPVLQEITGIIDTLNSVGLDYLSLTRDCRSLSNGELQRLRLATAMGSPLTGVMYIFDEPTVGLHPLDSELVLKRFSNLKERGNSIIVIEHDEESIRSSDYIIDVGPEGGSKGGEILYQGITKKFLINADTLTAKALRNGSLTVPKKTNNSKQEFLKIINCSKNNIKELSIELPLHRLTTVAGVSGAGKSSLVEGIIVDTLTLGNETKKSWKYKENTIESETEIHKVTIVDQKPIGKNARSTPASYLGLWDEIRKVFATTIEAKSRGWTASYFSYNTGKGRCPVCKGQGQLKLEMSFLADARLECETCQGTRYSAEANSVRYLDHTISQVLNLTFEEAKSLFTNHKKIHRVLHQACELGLDYLTLGQGSSTLSGGESQRIKLVAELSTPPRGHTLYVLDEPTTGLHRADVSRLMKMLSSLVEIGHSVILIEHDRDALLLSDHIIEMGPGPGDAGGKVIFSGSAQKLKRSKTPWGHLLGKPARSNKSTRPNYSIPANKGVRPSFW